MIKITITDKNNLPNFKKDKQYELKTEFVIEGKKEVRYFTVKDDKKKVHKFLPKVFYQYFTVVK